MIDLRPEVPGMEGVGVKQSIGSSVSINLIRKCIPLAHFEIGEAWSDFAKISPNRLSVIPKITQQAACVLVSPLARSFHFKRRKKQRINRQCKDIWADYELTPNIKIKNFTLA